MPRKTRTLESLLRALGGLEENREPAQVVLAEVREGRHRRAVVDAAWALEMRDLERDALVLRPLGAQVRRAELRAAGVEISVAVETPGGREQQGSGDGLLRQLLLLHPAGYRGFQLGAERFLRRRALVREDAHGERHEDRGNDRDRTPQQPALRPHVEERDREEQDQQDRRNPDRAED